MQANDHCAEHIVVPKYLFEILVKKPQAQSPFNNIFHGDGRPDGVPRHALDRFYQVQGPGKPCVV